MQIKKGLGFWVYFNELAQLIFQLQKSFLNISQILEMMEEEEDRMEVLIIQNPLDRNADHVRLSVALHAHQIRVHSTP